MKLSSKFMGFGVLGALLAFTGLEFLLGPGNWLILIPGMIVLFVLPGWLTLKNLGVHHLPRVEAFIYAIGLSVLAVMVLGASLSTGFIAAGWLQPLAMPYLVTAIDILNLGLLAGATLRHIPLGATLRAPFLTLPRILAFLVPPLLVALSVMGAVSLNNQGSNILACLALAAIGGFIVAIIWSGQRVPTALYPYALFWITLGLLLSVSLRSWSLSGHDILTEFYVFSLTKAHLAWNMQYFQDPYNACLSITVLPTVISQLLPIPGQWIFRILFQISFALTPVALFFMVRRFFKPSVAFLASVLFLAQPPLMQDFPFLTRQELAIMYFVLSLSALSARRLSQAQRIGLFSLFSLGMLFSHYSTTYIAIGLYTFAVTANLFLWRRSVRAGRISSLTRLLKRFIPSAQRLDVSNRYWTSKQIMAPSLWMLAALLVATFVWNTLFTHTSNNLSKFTGSTITMITNAGKSVASIHNPADAVHQLSRLFQQPSDDQLIKQYATLTTGVAAGASDEYSSTYPASTYANYNLIKHVDADLKSTINSGVVSIVAIARSLSRKLIIIFLLAGWAWLMWRQVRYRDLNRSITIMVTAAIGLLVTAMLLPQLAVDYDIMRTYQQLLVVLCLPAAIGGLALFSWLKPGARLRTISLVIGSYFLLTSAYIPQIVGSGEALMQLNNSGVYYNLYYTHQTEAAAIAWYSQHGDTNLPLYADWFAKKKITALSPTNVWVIDNVLPQNITTGGYVFVDYTNQTTATAYTYANGHVLSYQFPNAMLDSQKDTLYSNGTTSIRR